MGSIERLVTLREGAKPGIPKLEVQKIEQNSVHFTILVSEILVDPIELMELCPVERPKVDLNDSTPRLAQNFCNVGDFFLEIPLAQIL